MQVKAQINALLFRIASTFRSPNTTIDYIRGIRIEKHTEEGVIITATDGERFVILHDKSGFIDTQAVTIDISGDILGQIPKKRERAQEHYIVITDAHVELQVGFGEIIDEFEATYPADQGFPDWRMHIPEIESNPIEFYNSEDLDDFIDATKQLTGKDKFELSFAGKRGGIVIVRIRNFEDAFFLAIRKNLKDEVGIPEFAMKVTP